MAPRSFERPATIALGGSDAENGLALEGLYVPAEGESLGGAVIAPPHPEYGGSMESPVVTELAHACARGGLDSLRFNWRGVGASAGALTGDLEIADADYAAAIAFVEESSEVPLVACGYSFGAAAAARACRGRPIVRRLLLVAPPATMLDGQALSEFPGEVFLAVGARDNLANAVELEKNFASLPRVRFVSIPDTDHFFMSGLGALGHAAADWLKA
jgi:alpha/beta superfamily hydrolase